MTTVACNRKVMAADSRRTRGSFAYLSPPKISRVNGDLVCTTGSAAEGEAFLEWYKDQPKKIPTFKALNVLILTKEGAIFEVYEDGRLLEVIEPFYALGSGGELAIAAMAAGASPRRAVEIACKYDKNSGLPVQVERIK